MSMYGARTALPGRLSSSVLHARTSPASTAPPPSTNSASSGNGSGSWPRRPSISRLLRAGQSAPASVADSEAPSVPVLTCAESARTDASTPMRHDLAISPSQSSPSGEVCHRVARYCSTVASTRRRSNRPRSSGGPPCASRTAMPWRQSGVSRSRSVTRPVGPASGWSWKSRNGACR